MHGLSKYVCLIWLVIGAVSASFITWASEQYPCFYINMSPNCKNLTSECFFWCTLPPCAGGVDGTVCYTGKKHVHRDAYVGETGKRAWELASTHCYYKCYGKCKVCQQWQTSDYLDGDQQEQLKLSSPSCPGTAPPP
jgi:hypothetical protein